MWLLARVTSDSPSIVEREIHGEVFLPRETTRPTLPIRCVCRECNNGWMSRLENEAKPILERMLDDRPVGLDLAQRAIVGMWSMKTAMVLEAIDAHDQRVYTQEERARLRSLSAIPERSLVWLARVLEPTLLLSGKTLLRASESDERDRALATTFVFGHLAIQVASFRFGANHPPEVRVTTDVKRGAWSESTVRIWPADEATVSWPPASPMRTETEVHHFAERFRTSGLAMDAVQRLAV